MKLVHTLVLAACLVMQSPLAIAQWTKTMGQRGFTPGAPFDIKGLDSVNMVNGNLNVIIPITSLAPGRAGHSLDVNLVYNSAHWNKTYQDAQTVDGTFVMDRVGSEQPWQIGFQYGMTVETRGFAPACSYANPPHPPTTGNDILPIEGVVQYRTRLITPDGAQHVLYLLSNPGVWDPGDPSGDGWTAYDPAGTPSACLNSVYTGSSQWLTGNLTYATKDGTFLRLVTTGGVPPVGTTPGTAWENLGWVLYLPDGRIVHGTGDQTDSVSDKNDNTITFSSTVPCAAFPTLTGSFRSIQDDSPGSASRCIQVEGNTVRQRGALGNILTWTINWGVSDPAAFTYNCKDISPVSPYVPIDATCRFTAALNAFEVGRLDLPGLNCGSDTNCSSYRFLYEPQITPAGDSTGALTAILLPTGASIHYKYQPTYSPAGEASVTPFSILERRIDYQDPVLGAQSETSSYNIATQSCNTVATTGRGTTTHCFHNPLGSYGQLGGHVYSVAQPDGSSIETFWTPNPPNNSLFANANPVVRREVRNAANSTGTAILSSTKNFKTDVNGNVLQVDEYDWDSYASAAHPQDVVTLGALATPSFLLRTTKTTYLVPVPEGVYPLPQNPTADPQEYWHATSRLLRTPATVLVQHGPSQAPTTDSVVAYGYNTQGNLLTETHWNSETAGTIVTSHSYTPNGDVQSDTDPSAHVTQYQYTSSTHPYPTDLVDAYGTAQARHWTFAWDESLGQRTSETDMDNAAITSVIYDIRGRATQLSEANGARVTYTTFDDLARTVTTTAPLTTAADNALQTVVSIDQLGRKWKTRNATLNTEVQELIALWGTSTYQLVSNPYTGTSPSSETTMGWTRTTMDSSGRVSEVRSFSGLARPSPWPDGNSTTTGATATTYSATTASGAQQKGAVQVVTDPAGKQRELRTDGLGRLAQVIEAWTDTVSHTDLTSYTYDTLDHLTGVNQSGQVRGFSYSSLGRLLSATNPESGTIHYTYYANGNLYTRTDARNIVTTTMYDALNRPTSKSYSDGTPTVNYAYGISTNSSVPNRGRLLSTDNGVSKSSYSYDTFGRVITSSQQTPASSTTPYSFGYVYKLNNALSQVTYPSNRVVTYGFDGGGRVNQVANGLLTSGVNYATGISYAPQGGILSMTAGTGLVETRQYNARLQPTSVQVNSLMTLGFTYGGSNNNGNVQTQEITRPSVSSSQSYGYDGVNRLTTAAQTGTTPWSQTYGYDAFGNRWLSQTGLPNLTIEVPQTQNWFNPVPALVTNQIQGQSWLYDAAGNVLRVGSAGSSPLRTSAYDAENHQISVATSSGSSATYAYDGEGRRVKKTVGSEITTFVYDASGQLAAEYGGATVPSDETGTRYLFSDHLGSTRLITNADGSQTKAFDYLPFGEEIGAFYPGDADARGRQSVKYTSKERDAETGLDYFGARYYSSAQGRFTSPDEWAGGIVDAYSGGAVGSPGPLPYADITDPQTINKYAYVRNNPMRYTDPDGHVLDVLADIAFIGYDIYDIAKNGASVTSVLALGADVVGAAVPFATGLGAGVRAAHAVEAGVHATEAGIHLAEGGAHAAEAGRVGKSGGKTFDQARKEAFEKAGMTDAKDVKFTKVDPKTGTVVEFKGRNGAEVNYDGPHDTPGPGHDSQHVGWQTEGKRNQGGTQRDNIPYTGPQHPSRSPVKGDGVIEPH